MTLPTPQQKAAIEARNVSVALSAGAGCGKTSVLTRRFLSHLEPAGAPDELASLVAITFTERAAREMRERIREQCRERLREAPAAEAPYWLDLVRELDAARISTIHGFCGALLRSHAVEAGIDPLFSQLDEALAESFLQKEVRVGLHALLAADDTDAAELVFELGLSRTTQVLASLVTQRYRIDFADWEQKTAEELACLWDERWRGEVVPRLLRETAESTAAQAVLDLVREHMPDNPAMRERCTQLLERIPRLPEAADPDEAIASILEHAYVRGAGGKSQWESEEIYESFRDTFEALRELLRDLQEQLECDPSSLARGAEIGMCALRATQRVGQFYDERKQEAAVLDFNDLLLMTRDLLRDHEEVRRRAAAGIRLLMVDEFQDTDPIQEDLVRWLCGDRLLDGRLFIVGDAKQSIYRFRRAEPQVFHRLRGQMPEAGRLPLSLNFRSQPEILAFVNALFDGAQGLGPDYEPLEAHAAQLSPKPGIEFLFAVNGTNGGEEGEGDKDQEQSEDQNVVARRRREGEWIARRLTQLLTDGVPRVRYRDAAGEPRLRTAELKDIVILFRAMTDVRYYEEALRKCGLDCYVVGGRAFFAQQEVFDLVNLCRCLDDAGDLPALVGVLRSPLFSLSDDAIFALGRNPARALWDVPPARLSDSQKEQVRFAARVLAELREQKDRLPIAQLLNLAIERTGYDASVLTEFMGSRKLANLRKLIDMAREFDQSGLFTLADFVERLQESVADEVHEPLAATHPESSNVIRLMSIHQSKGLEFPIVVIADADRQSPPAGSSAAFHPQLGPVVGLPPKFGVKRRHIGTRMLQLSEQDEEQNESLRLFYVAATRAADHLIISANFAKPGAPTGLWLQLISERFDLLTGQPRQAPTSSGTSILVKYSNSLPQILVHHAEPGPITLVKDAGPRPVELDRLRELLEQTEPGALPGTMQVMPADPRARLRFSVSEIEVADQVINGRDEEPRRGQAAASARSKTRNQNSEIPNTKQRLLFEPEGPTSTPETMLPVETAEQLGTLVHAALERADFRNPQQIPELVAGCCAGLGVEVDEPTRDVAVRCVNNVLSSSLREELATARQVHREIEFLVSVPPYTIAGTIDCLFESSRGQWVILDYKTGSHAAGTDPGELLAPYEIQLGLYALAVRQLIQRFPDRIELVYMRTAVERIPFVASEARVAAIAARVVRAIEHLRSNLGT